MMKRKKIGILTLHSQINYGGVLQAYALQKYLRDHNYDAELINYWCSRGNGYLSGGVIGKKILSIKVLKRLAIQFLKNGFIYAELKRRKKTIEFLQKHCRVGGTVYRNAEELKLLDQYDCVIVGSDQIWNPKWHGIPNPFLLGELHERHKRISYAASFGVEEIPKDRRDEFKSALEKFDHLSCREKQGSEIIKRLIGRDAEWVLDPTLLLAKDDWEELAAQGDHHDNGYVFCYWLGDLKTIWKPLVKLAKKKKLKVRLYADPHIFESSFGKIKSIFARLFFACVPQIVCCFDAGPLEFVRGVSHSTAVVSDSFHALMFSCVFSKPVKIYVRSSEHRKSISSRLVDFADYFGLNCVEFNPPACEIILSDVDYTKYNKLIDQKRSVSAAFLKSAI